MPIPVCLILLFFPHVRIHQIELMRMEASSCFYLGPSTTLPIDLAFLCKGHVRENSLSQMFGLLNSTAKILDFEDFQMYMNLHLRSTNSRINESLVNLMLKISVSNTSGYSIHIHALQIQIGLLSSSYSSHVRSINSP